MSETETDDTKTEVEATETKVATTTTSTTTNVKTTKLSKTQLISFIVALLGFGYAILLQFFPDISIFVDSGTSLLSSLGIAGISSAVGIFKSSAEKSTEEIEAAKTAATAKAKAKYDAAKAVVDEYESSQSTDTGSENDGSSN